MVDEEATEHQRDDHHEDNAADKAKVMMHEKGNDLRNVGKDTRVLLRERNEGGGEEKKNED